MPTCQHGNLTYPSNYVLHVVASSRRVSISAVHSTRLQGNVECGGGTECRQILALTMQRIAWEEENEERTDHHAERKARLFRG